MDYPNLLETAFDEFSAMPADATAGNAAGAGDFASAPQLLIWRQIRWSNRRPLIEVEPVVPGGGAEGAHNRASQAAGVPYMTGESAPSQESSPAQRGVPSGVRIQIPLTPGAYLGLRIPHDSEGEPYRYCAGYTIGVSDDAAPETRGVSAGIRRVPCPEGTRIQRGQQCPHCTARDEFTALHSAHLYPGTLTESMRAYAMLEHRLYIATFPDGTHKDEPWIPSLAMNRPYAALRAQSPEPLAPCDPGLGDSGTESGAAGFFCTGAAGQFLSAHTGDADAAFLVNTAAWRNVLVEPAQEFTRVRVQGSLF